MNQQSLFDEEFELPSERILAYYNTNKETGQTLQKSISKAKDQQTEVYNHFKRTGLYYTPCEIWQKFMPDTPITSIRRAITNLTSEGLLIKTDHLHMGMYDKLVHCWKVAE